MATPKLDGAGTAKLETLESALSTLQSIHAIVEQMAVAIRNGDSTTSHVQRVRRIATPLATLLKGQFGMISDVVMNMILVGSRGASEQVRLRGMRENVASIRTQLEIAHKRVIELHTVDADSKPG
jgi:hypothetical protein